MINVDAEHGNGCGLLTMYLSLWMNSIHAAVERRLLAIELRSAPYGDYDKRSIVNFAGEECVALWKASISTRDEMADRWALGADVGTRPTAWPRSVGRVDEYTLLDFVRARSKPAPMFNWRSHVNNL